MKLTIEITLTQGCKTPADIAYALSELGESFSYMKKWPEGRASIYTDDSLGDGDPANGFWEVK